MSPVALNQPVQVWRGDPVTVMLRFWQDAAQTTPRNLTTVATAWASDVRASMTDSEPSATFAVDASSAASGVLTLSLTGAQTSALSRTVGTLIVYGFDVQGTGGSESPVTIVRGTLSVDGDYTR